MTNLPEQIIIHVDMDAFYASVEIRDNPALKGKPLIIGSLPEERGVVATCSYEARKYGIYSAMNIKEAYRLCPNGIYMHPNFDKYKTVSAQLHKIWDSYASVAEAIALDEVYLDVTQKAETFDGARKIAKLIKQRTKDELGLTCSVGVAYSKTAAKIASEEKKPDGYFEIPTAKDFVDLIIDRDVRVLYSVGKMTAQKLYSSGIHTVRDIQEKKETVTKLLGKQGKWLTELAFGTDNHKVVQYRPQDAKSISREVTFQKDVKNYNLLKDVLFLLALCVENRAKKYDLYGNGVTLKITYSNMKGITRSKITSHCNTAFEIYKEALYLMKKIEKSPIRLIGVGIYNLSNSKNHQLTLDDFMTENKDEQDKELKSMFNALQKKYNLKFAENLNKLYRSDILYKTIEYMRKHSN
ncbi:DNA polymerase IV [Candidatus Ruminimicrobiellum ovillum]|uniref:DNA polymerase IV n=1 Tax=Candidatus Ruminimicrobiellum ovillum TaxID=1947927 RepID=UPI00355A0F28